MKRQFSSDFGPNFQRVLWIALQPMNDKNYVFERFKALPAAALKEFESPIPVNHLLPADLIRRAGPGSRCRRPDEERKNCQGNTGKNGYHSGAMDFAKITHRHWVYGILIPTIYVIIELSFNYRLVTVASDTVNEDILSGLEFWGRVISGIGLGLGLYRIRRLRLPSRLTKFMFCLGLGVLTMWHVQSSLTDYLVASASPEDKKAAIGLAALAEAAAAGQLKTLTGDPLVTENLDSFQEKTVMALFPAASLHVISRDEQIAHWLSQIYQGNTPSEALEFSPDTAYRNLIVPPIAIGLSIFFALFNLALVIGFFARTAFHKARVATVTVVFFILILFSIQQGGWFLSSPGYRHAMKTPLWQTKPLLALLVEWSGRAAPAWGVASEISHQVFMFGYEFKRPY